jgi:hypothetical protein
VYWTNITIAYIKIFKVNTVLYVGNFNDSRYDIIEYRSGKIHLLTHAINGIAEGWSTEYYDNGNIKSKLFFKHGKPEGERTDFFEDGKLEFERYYKNGKFYGSVYSFGEDGRIKKYSTIDITGMKFCEWVYNTDKKNYDMNGFVVSTNYYSINLKSGDTIIISHSRNPSRIYSRIRDYYISVATPPYGLKMIVNVTINSKHFDNLPVKENTVKVSNAFPMDGKYEVFIESHLLDTANYPVNGINIKTEIIKN